MYNLIKFPLYRKDGKASTILNENQIDSIKFFNDELSE
jgi:hypothetical protein